MKTQERFIIQKKRDTDRRGKGGATRSAIHYHGKRSLPANTHVNILCQNESIYIIQYSFEKLWSRKYEVSFLLPQDFHTGLGFIFLDR